MCECSKRLKSSGERWQTVASVRAEVGHDKRLPQELNWFAMETKVRQLVQELIEPTIKRGVQDRIDIEELNGQLQKQKGLIDNINFALYKSKERDTVFETIDKRFETIVSLKLESTGGHDTNIAA